MVYTSKKRIYKQNTFKHRIKRSKIVGGTPLPVLQLLSVSQLDQSLQDMISKVDPSALSGSATSLQVVILPTDRPFVLKHLLDVFLFQPKKSEKATFSDKPSLQLPSLSASSSSEDIADFVIDKINDILLPENVSQLGVKSITEYSILKDKISGLYKDINIDQLQVVELPDKTSVVMKYDSSSDVFMVNF